MKEYAEQEKRLARLEEDCYFQEQRLNALDSAVKAQQEELDKISRTLAELRPLLRELREKLEPYPETVLPPHSLPEKY